MTGSESWARLDELLDAALDQPPERRRAWLTEACAGDERLHTRALSLLELAETDDVALIPGGALEGPLWHEVAKELEHQGKVELSPGSRLGPYEIRALLGSGGMGRVYRAHDGGRDRDVALKVLSEEFAAEPSSLRRFEREAKLLSRLSHEGIARLHGFEVLEERPVLVLELAEGATLDEILSERALPPADAVAIARQVAEALAEAHGKGIVHRDLKPSNVKISSTGGVKVLDFGLARRFRRAEPSGDSSSGTLTHSGMVLGTIPYMSPEQAQGERVDERTDIWALGCLLYEMLTGRRAMSSRTVADLLQSLLRDDVDLGALPPETPAGLRRVIRRCLRRDPGKRYQDVRDARLDLEEVGAESLEVSRPPSATGPAWRSVLPWSVAGLALMGALATLLPSTGRNAPPPGKGIRRLVLDLPPGVSLPRDAPGSPAALSPDGSTVVLVGEEGGAARRLFVRRLEHLAWDALPGTEGARQPFLSADGSAAGFFSGRRLMKVSLDGEEPQAVTDVVEDPGGGTWAPEGTIVFGPSSSSGLLRVDARGGTPQPLTELAEGELSHRWPQVLPDGGTVLFTVEYRGSTFDDAGIETVSLETGKRRRLVRGGAFGRFVPGGHVAYARGGQLFAVPFDLSRGRATGAAVRGLDGVAYDPRTGATKLALAGDGTLVYVPAPSPGEAPRLVLAEGWAR
ncbi:MAG: protein kinase, partial [Gemmatimonadota bacterium]